MQELNNEADDQMIKNPDATYVINHSAATGVIRDITSELEDDKCKS